MPVIQRACYAMGLALGFVLVIGGGLTAFYIAPTFHEMSHRAAAGLLAALGCLAGVAVIARCFSKIEAASKPARELHVPGLDAVVEETSVTDTTPPPAQ